jgi:hypothetical protein
LIRLYALINLTMKRCNYAFLPMDIQQHLTLSVDYVNNTL